MGVFFYIKFFLLHFLYFRNILLVFFPFQIFFLTFCVLMFFLLFYGIFSLNFPCISFFKKKILSFFIISGIGLDACLATLVLLKLKCKKRGTSSWMDLIRLKDCPVKTVQNTVLQYLYYTLTPRQQWDSDYEFSLLEDEGLNFSPIKFNTQAHFFSPYSYKIFTRSGNNFSGRNLVPVSRN